MSHRFLLIDTSVFSPTVAVWDAERDALIMTGGQSRRFSEQMPEEVPSLLSALGLQASDISAVGICSGPGSYTGLRMGASFAKGFCMGLNIPLVAVSRFQLLSNLARKQVGTQPALLSLIDAGRMEVYASYTPANSIVSEIGAPVIIQEDSFAGIKEETLYYVGNGASKCQEYFEKRNWKMLEVHEPDASDLCRQVFLSFSQKKFASIESFEPDYLKEYIPGRVSQS